MSSPEQALIAKLAAVHQRAASGDREAVHFIKSLKTRALSGDDWSRKVYNTLAVIHHRKKQGPAIYAKAEAYYLRLVAKEPTAMAKLQTLIQRVRAGDEDARKLFAVLRSIHGKHKSSAFKTAAPTFSGYGYHPRPGTIIGASHYGHGGGYPMNHSFYRGPVFGAEPQPLTAQAVANLISLMIRVRAMPIAAAIFSPGSVFSNALSSFDSPEAQGFLQALQPGGGGGGGGGGAFTTTPSPSGFSTVPASSVMSTASSATSSSAQGGASAAAMEAYRLGAFQPWGLDEASRLQALGRAVSDGQFLVNNNPPFRAMADRLVSDPEKIVGYFFGCVISLGNTVAGPGQDKARDELLLSSPYRDVNDRRLEGFNIARSQMYAYMKARGPITLPQSVKLTARGPGMTDAQRAAMLANQGICNNAAVALARNSPAAPGLIDQCKHTRRQNIMAGQYFADSLSPDDPGYRVALTDAGTVVVNANPQLKQFAASLMAQDPSGARSRGFIMAMGVRAGKMDPAFPAFVRPALSRDPNLIAGFDAGMNMK